MLQIAVAAHRCQCQCRDHENEAGLDVQERKRQQPPNPRPGNWAEPSSQRRRARRPGLVGSNLVEHRQVPDRDVAHTPVCLVWSKFCRCRARAAVALLVGETKLRQSCGFSARGHMIFVKVPCIGCRAIEVAISKCSGGHAEHKVRSATRRIPTVGTGQLSARAGGCGVATPGPASARRNAAPRRLASRKPGLRHGRISGVGHDALLVMTCFGHAMAGRSRT